MSTTYPYRRLIVYDRKTGDFAMYLNGELVGYEASYVRADQLLKDLVYRLLSQPAAQTPTTEAVP